MNDAAELGGRRPARAPRSEARVERQPGFILHAYAWRETSLIVEALTRDLGRLALVARGAKRPTSQFRGILMPFSPLLLSWSGRTELKTLVRAEWQGGLTPLRGEGLLAAFYLNELVVRLLPRADPHPALFGSYVQALAQLAWRAQGREQVLRGFELDLLRDLGVAPSFRFCGNGEPIEPRHWYQVDPHGGLLRCLDADDPQRLSGTMLMALARRDLSDVSMLPAVHALLRRLIGYHLEGKPLNSRRVLSDLRAL